MHPSKTYVLFSVVLSASMFAHATTYVPFLLEIGLSFADIALINAVYWFVIVFCEVPTGMLADRVSRSTALCLGSIFFVLGNGLYGCAQTLSQSIISEVVLAVGSAFLSGVQQAWITDALIARGESDRLRSTFASASSWRGLVAIPASLTGSWWAGTYSTRSVWWVCTGIALIACFIVWRQMRNIGDPVTKITEWRALGQSLHALRSKSALRWVTGLACVMGCVVPFNHYWAPFFQGRGVEVGSLAYVWAPMYATVAFGAWCVRHHKAHHDERTWIVVSALGAGIGLAIMGWPPGLLLPLLFACVHEFGRGAFEPLLDTYTQQHVESSYRATYGSLQSLIARSGYGFILILVTWFMTGRTGEMSITLVWTASGLLLAFLALLFFLTRPDRLAGKTKFHQPCG